jgi:hypothetical protein
MPAAFRIRQLLLNLNEQRPPQLREQMRSLNYVLAGCSAADSQGWQGRRTPSDSGAGWAQK